MGKDGTMNPYYVKAILLVLVGLLNAPEQRARRFLSKIERLRAPVQKNEANSILVGGHNAGRRMMIPENETAWLVNVPVEPLVVWDPDAPIIAPPEPELYEENGRSLRGLRKFMIRED